VVAAAEGLLRMVAAAEGLLRMVAAAEGPLRMVAAAEGPLRMVAAAEGLLRMVAWGLEHRGVPRPRHLPHAVCAGIEDPEPVTDGGEP
jgi:hypothetical protein